MTDRRTSLTRTAQGCVDPTANRHQQPTTTNCQQPPLLQQADAQESAQSSTRGLKGKPPLKGVLKRGRTKSRDKGMQQASFIRN